MFTEMKAIDALRLLINPGESRVRAQFRIREGQRLSVQVNELVKGTKISKKAYEAALDKPKSLGLPSWADNKPEGFLFPDTYELTAKATATSTLRQMTSRFESVSGELGLEAAAKRLKYSPYDVVIVASIIEREAGRAEDRAKIARVLYNRLAKDRKLELDSTVTYAEKLNTVTTTPEDRESDSPYNTYKYEGLPPGPIAAPGRAALEAALEPASGKWLYFVAVNLDTGESKFAETFSEHSKNVRAVPGLVPAGRCRQGPLHVRPARSCDLDRPGTSARSTHSLSPALHRARPTADAGSARLAATTGSTGGADELRRRFVADLRRRAGGASA